MRKSSLIHYWCIKYLHGLLGGKKALYLTRTLFLFPSLNPPITSAIKIDDFCDRPV